MANACCLFIRWVRPIDREAKITSTCYQDGSMSIEPSWAFHFTGLNPLQPKPAFSAAGRVSLAPTADSWAVRSGPPASVALAESAGPWGSGREGRGSAAGDVAGCGCLGLTFYFSFAGLSAVGNLLQSC